MLKGYVKCVYNATSTNNIRGSTQAKSSLLQDVVKADASHVGVEKYIAEIFSSWAVFRPQYMIGSGNNKDCEEWFFDRKYSYP